jgi:hypothetical protein
MIYAYNLRISDAVGFEGYLDQIAGVAGGLFARRPADVLVVGTEGEPVICDASRAADAAQKGSTRFAGKDQTEAVQT